MKECLFLVKNGVPFDVAFELEEIERAAWSIIFSEMNGAKFDWNAMSFIEE